MEIYHMKILRDVDLVLDIIWALGMSIQKLR